MTPITDTKEQDAALLELLEISQKLTLRTKRMLAQVLNTQIMIEEAKERVDAEGPWVTPRSFAAASEMFTRQPMPAVEEDQFVSKHAYLHERLASVPGMGKSARVLKVAKRKGVKVRVLKVAKAKKGKR